MSGAGSCIIRHFKHYGELSDEDEALLRSLERDPTEVHAHHDVWHENDAARHFYTVRSGWGYSYRDMPDGTRQILDLFLPGDIIGLREFAFGRHLTGVTMATEGVVCAFPIRRLLDVFHGSPTVTTIFFAIAAREQALLTERLVSLGRRSAREKLAHLIAEIHVRLHRTSPSLGGKFRLPLSQQVIADMLGLSAVHVSRTMSELSSAGLVVRDRDHVHIPDFERLAAAASFSDKYLRDNVRDLLKAAGHAEDMTDPV